MMARGVAIGVTVGVFACFTKPGQPHDRADAGGDGPTDGAIDSSDAAVAPNYMFVTSRKLDPGGLGGTSGADIACMTLAGSAGLTGTYVAWLSLSGTNAVDRLGSARGWVRPDGNPFAATAADIVAGKIFYPPILDETNTNVGVGQQVVTGTTENGIVAGLDCNGYTAGSAQTIYGFADAGTVMWTNFGSAACNSATMRLYCFGIDRAASIPIPNTTGPRAFVSSPTNLYAGSAALNNMCQTEATINGMGGTFKAVIATTTTPAMTNVGGTPAMPWVRRDGVAVTSDFSTFTAPLDQDAGSNYLSAFVATGGSAFALATGSADKNCGNWGSSSDTTDFGMAARTYKGFYAGTSLPCGPMQRVYCVETP